MLADNDRFRDFLGVTAWHKAGFTGKRGLTASGEDFSDGKGHPYQTYLIFKEFAPDREVIYLPPDMRQSAAEVAARKVDAMWASLSIAGGGEDQDAPMEQTAPFFSYFMSAGNDGEGDYNSQLRGKYIYGVGSYHLMADGTTSPVSYSSVTEHVDFSAPELVSFPTASGRGSPFPGTSCAAPVLAGMAALVNDFFIDKTGKPLSSAMMYQFLQDCSVDMQTDGKDTKTGWGAPILPNPSEIDMGRYAGEMYHSRDIDDLRADVAENCRRFVEIAKADGYPVLITGTVRDKAYQEYCYYKGTSKSKVPTFHSMEAGLAFDICKNVNGQEYSDNDFWNYCGALGKKMGFTWGGDWTSIVDKPHFQWDGGGQYSGTDILAGRYPPTMPLYEEDEHMTQDTFNKLYDGVNPMYETLSDVPAYWQTETQALIDSGKLKGDGTGKLNIRHETLRAVIVGNR